MINNELSRGIIHLLDKQPFFGHLIQIMRRHKDESVKTAGVSVKDGIINLYYSPSFLLKIKNDLIEYSKTLGNTSDSHTLVNRAIAAVLEHECLHVLNLHLESPYNKGKNMKLLNLAMDCAINQQIPDIKLLSNVNFLSEEEKKDIMTKNPNMTSSDFKNYIDVDGLSRMFEVKLEYNRDYHYYYDEIEKSDKYQEMKQKAEKELEEFLDKMTQAGDDHSSFGEGNSEGQSSEIVKEVIKEAARQAMNKSRGNMPGNVSQLVSDLLKSKNNWKQILRTFVANNGRTLQEPTRKKINKKFGINVPTNKNIPTQHLAVIVDTSGSCFDAETQRKFFTEINAMHKAGALVTVIECDTQVGNVYKFNPKKTIQTSGGGGTTLQPAFDHAKKLKDKVDAVICVTDGYIESNINTNKLPTMWVLYNGTDNYLPPKSRKINLQD